MNLQDLGSQLALVNATLNGTSAVLIIGGALAIRRRLIDRHRQLMQAAFLVSAIFLICYLTRVAVSGTHRYPGDGLWKTTYLALLFSHMSLAAVTPFLVIRSIYLARQNRIPEHRRLVKWTLPIWLYVSITGVLVYWLLYHPPG